MLGFDDAQRTLRRRLGRTLFVLVAAFAMLSSTVGHAFAIESLRQYAGIVVDAKSGEVLYEHEADARRYPASISKVMTLYILFQELEAGTVRLEDRMRVSKHAASAVPTKLGLKPGWTITVKDAMRSLVTLSANDMARVIAEHLSGSEEEFAKRMTATARALGMSRTTYKNASGLPDAEQLTTARDQATLGIAIYQHFPQYYELFQTKSFTFGGRTYRSHNRLLGSDGVDGIKTGYIKASGSNLLTAARRDGRHIVVAAIGFNTAAARDGKVRELVKSYLPKGHKGSYLETAQLPQPGRMGTLRVAEALPVTPKPYPSFREVTVQLASVTEPQAGSGGVEIGQGSRMSPGGEQPALAAVNMLGSASASPAAVRGLPDEAIGAWLGATYALDTALEDTAPESAGAAPEESAEQAASQPAPEIRTASTASTESSLVPPPAPVAAPPTAPAWVVQVGAAPSQEGADSLLDAAATALARLQGMQSYVELFEKGGQVFYRARFAGFEALEDARGVCKQLLAAKMSCLALQS